MLANAAMIEARDRAEAEERLRLRQGDTHRALEEASARAQGLLEHPAAGLKATPLDSPSLQMDTSTKGPSSASTSQPVEPPAKPRVLPPKFLTPATPRKPKAFSNFKLPVLDAEEAATGQGQSNAAPRANSMPEQGQAQSPASPPPAMPSRPPSETESWTPVARRRGS